MQPAAVGNNKISIKGILRVGQIAANIENPEPYKGKGIKYENEVVHVSRKSGKAVSSIS
jgi:large subunit ribosomal protein L6